MDSEKWTNVFTILSIIVIADGRVYKEEVDSFIAQVEALKAELGSDTLVTKRLAFDWFVAHRDMIAEELAGDRAHFYVVRALQKLQDFPDHAALLRAMESVSLSDEVFQVEEQSILELAHEIWRTGKAALR